MSDVFISYAHIDDAPLTEGQKGWISQFHRCLEIRLSQLLGEMPKIWRDPKLTGTDVFGDAIVHELPEAKTFISIISPRYIKSEWCIREVSEFCKYAEAQGGILIKNKSRIIKVVKTPVVPDEVPAPLDHYYSSLLGFEFYELDPETGRPREFNEEFGMEAKRRFMERVYDLAYDLCALLKEQKEEPALPHSSTSSNSGKTIYLATTTSDLQADRDQIQRELLERGHNVLPNEPLPMVGGEFEKKVQEYLQNSQLAIHLIGSRYGLIPEDSDASIVELQNRLAAERCSSPDFSRIIWMPRDLAPTDDRQKTFMRLIFEDANAQRGAEILEDSVEKLKGLMLDKLMPPPEVEQVVVASSDKGAPLVYLICDPSDEEAVDSVEDYLFDQGLEVSRPLFQGTSEAIESAHRQFLLACDAVLVYYGSGNRTWVDMKLLDLMQAPGYGRTKPMLAKAVCVAPPEDRQKLRFRTHSAEIIRLAEQFSPEPLEPFVKSLTAKEGGIG